MVVNLSWEELTPVCTLVRLFGLQLLKKLIGKLEFKGKAILNNELCLLGAVGNV